MVHRRYIAENNNSSAWGTVLNELYRLGRVEKGYNNFQTYLDEFNWLLQSVEWYKIYSLCERIYAILLTDVRDNQLMQILVSIEEVKEYFTHEINNLLCEENLDYRFNNGQFEREGRLHTQKSIKRMGAILSNSELYLVRQHYNKALKFFGEKPIPDLTNCVKESMCALESCIEIITGKKASVNFTKAIRELQKSDLINIPPTITESIIKIYAFRGESQGVAHSSPEGSKVTETEAELILNLVAAYITYLVDSLLIRKEDIPF